LLPQATIPAWLAESETLEKPMTPAKAEAFTIDLAAFEVELVAA
jgi:hypothetical protein